MGTAQPYCHVHRHDMYSLYDGFGTSKYAAQYAARMGVPALGLTNHGNVCGLIDHYFSCKEAGVKPILGMEAYLVKKHPPVKGMKRYHITLVALTNDGYRNLLLLADASNRPEAFYYRPTITTKLLLDHAQGLAVLTGCPSGPVSKLLTEAGEREAGVFVEKLRDGFKDRLYVEVMSNGYDGELNEKLVRLARRVKVPLALTHDAHYVGAEDREAYERLMGMHRGDDWNEGRQNLWMPNAQDALTMAKGLTGREFCEALVGTSRLVDQSLVDLDRIRPAMPEIAGADALLAICVQDGLKVIGQWSNVLYQKRAGQELEVIKATGLSSFFCINSDIVRWAGKNGIETGPGRGSAAGSLVAYALGITKVDPVRFHIGFERFLRLDKKTAPDIDLDFDADHQARVVEHVVSEYGGVPIAAFGYYRHSNLVNDLCKIYGDDQRGTLEKLEGLEKVDDQEEREDRVHALGAAAKAYERFVGTVRYVGSHPGGVVVAEKRDRWMIPAMYVHGKRQAQFDMYSVERINALKVDILSLDTVSLLSRLARVTKEKPSDRYDDAATWDLICAGNCDGVFQMESRGGQELAQMIAPRNIEELAVVISMNRPGPLELGLPVKYAERTDYDPASAKGVARHFADTRGVPVYQDQVWQLCVKSAHMTPQEADGVIKIVKATTQGDRLAMADYIAKTRVLFVERITKHSKLDEERAGRLFDAITGYGFNKAHAVSYAIISYCTAWYKAHHPLHFCHAHLIVKERKPQRYKYEKMAVDMGIVLQSPHVNGSASYSIEDLEGELTIRRGYLQIKGVGPAAGEAVAAGAPYRSVTDFEERCEVNVKVDRVLRDAGALEWDPDKQIKMAARYVEWLRKSVR